MCTVIGCSKKSHNKSECSFHLRLRLYGLCKNGCSTPAQAKHGFCSRCVLRGFSPPKNHQEGKQLNTNTHRYCWDCKEVKEIRMFPRNRSRASGYNSMCKNCMIIRNNGYSPEEVFEFMRLNTEQGIACAKCLSIEELEVDHIFPKSRGGSDNMKNLQILCSPHNKSKGDREVVDYRLMKYTEQIKKVG